MISPRILVADDDPVILDVVRRYLIHDGMEVVTTDCGSGALAELDRGRVDLAVLDVMMPDLSGIDVCRSIRTGVHTDLPVIMLTALGEAEDRVLGLETGADDYVTKPFSPRELGLRIRSVLRRATAPPVYSATTIAGGGVTINMAGREVVVDGAPVSTTKREFDLLAFFLTNPDVVYSREEMLDKVWGWSFGDLSTVTVHIKRLRAKLGGSGHIETVWGQGYRWSSHGD